MVEAVGVDAETVKLIDISGGHDLVGLSGPLPCDGDERPEQSARRELSRVSNAQIGFEDRTKRRCNGAVVRGIGSINVAANESMAAVVLGNAILMHIPSGQYGANAIAVDPERGARLRICPFPHGTKEWFGVRQNNNLLHAIYQSAHLFNRCQGTVFVKARHRIVDNNDLVGQVGLLFQGREEERERERVAVTRAQGSAK